MEGHPENHQERFNKNYSYPKNVIKQDGPKNILIRDGFIVVNRNNRKFLGYLNYHYTICSLFVYVLYEIKLFYI